MLLLHPQAGGPRRPGGTGSPVGEPVPQASGTHPLRWPPLPAVTDHHKCTLVQFWRPGVLSGPGGLKSRCWQDQVLRRLRGRICLLDFSDGPPPGSFPRPPPPPGQQAGIFQSPSSSEIHSPASFEDAGGCTGPTRVIQDSLPSHSHLITPGKALCHVDTWEGVILPIPPGNTKVQ